MRHSCILEVAHHVQDQVHLPKLREERRLGLAPLSPPGQRREVETLQGDRGDFLGMEDCCEAVQAGLGDLCDP
jgi:hypothetical protein